MTIEVRENLNIEAPAFIEGQGVDADAAYQRLAITRKMLKEYKAAINATNTVDVVGEHKELYADVETSLKLIALKEERLIHQCK